MAPPASHDTPACSAGSRAAARSTTRLWRMRARGMLLLLCAHLPGLAVMALARGKGPRILLELVPVAAAALLASCPG